MTDKIKGLFGGGEKDDDKDDSKAKARDFINRFSQGDPSEGYTKEEAAQHLETTLKKASPDQIQRATKKAVENLNPDQRAQFAEMLKKRQAGEGMVQINRTGESASPQPGAAAQPGGGGDGGLDDILGGLLGGGAGGGGGLGGLLGGLLGGGAASGGSGGGLGDILGGLLGGGGDDKKADASAGFTQGDSSGGGGSVLGGLGDLLDSPIGKTVLAGVAAFAAKEMLDKD